MASDENERDDDGRDDPDIERTADPWEAQSVIDDRGGYPAHAPKSEGQGDEGLLRVGFRTEDEDLKQVSWEEFREEFEEKELALVYSTDGTPVEGDQTVALRERANA